MAFSLTAENDPLSDMKTLLDESWIESATFPKPELDISNDPDNAVQRLDMTSNDIILITTGGGEQIKYRGNIQYYDRYYPVTLTIQTSISRGRLRNLWKMCKAIFFDNKWAFPSYQLIVMQRYTEMLNTDTNVWRAIVEVSLQSNGVSAETLL
jgi:hypothetical protein